MPGEEAHGEVGERFLKRSEEVPKHRPDSVAISKPLCLPCHPVIGHLIWEVGELLPLEQGPFEV